MNIDHPLQSLVWEETRKSMGTETVRIDGLLLTLHQIPYTKYKIGYLPRSKMPLKKTLNNLYDFGRKNNLIFIKIEPYEERSNKDVEYEKLTKSKHALFPDWTQILDLNKTEEELLKQMHPKTRYNIRLAQKKGVIVKEESTDSGFETFIKLYFETTKRQGYFGHDYRYHKTVWNNFKNNNLAHILIAYYNNIPLAAYELWHYDDIFYYVYGGTSNLYRNLMASNLLMFEAIKLGKKLNAKKLDMWGSLPSNYDKNHPWAGFTRFKEGYGTTFIQFLGSYDLIINPLLYKVYNIAYFFRNIYLKIRS